MATNSAAPARGVRIRWRDLDACGHVNNAVFVTYVEEMQRDRLALVLGELGTHADFVTARVAIDFEREVRLEDEQVQGTCALVRVGRSSVTMRVELFTSGNTRAAGADVVLVARDDASGRPRPLSEAERSAFERPYPAGAA